MRGHLWEVNTVVVFSKFVFACDEICKACSDINLREGHKVVNVLHGSVERL